MKGAAPDMARLFVETWRAPYAKRLMLGFAEKMPHVSEDGGPRENVLVVSLFDDRRFMESLLSVPDVRRLQGLLSSVLPPGSDEFGPVPVGDFGTPVERGDVEAYYARYAEHAASRGMPYPWKFIAK